MSKLRRIIPDSESQDIAPNPRALNATDRIALVCAALVLALAPLLGGGFAAAFGEGYQAVGPLIILEFLGFPEQYIAALGLPVLLLLIALGFAVLLAREIARPVAIGAVRGLEFATIGMGLWAALSLTRTPALHTSLNVFAALLAALLLGGLVTRLSRDRKALEALHCVAVGAGSVAAAVAVHEYLGKFREGIPYHRAFGTFANPDFLAGYVLLTLPLSLAAFAATSRREARLCFGVGTLLQSAALLLTGSRAGVAIGLLSLAVWVGLSVWSRALSGRGKAVGMALGIFAVGAALASTPTLSRVVARPAAQGAPAAPLANVQAASAAQSHSGAFRRYTWMGTFRMAKANPILGAGVGSYDVTYPRYAETAFTAHAHNGYLQWAAETGFPGLLLFLTVLAAAFSFSLHVLTLGRHRQADEDEDEGASDGTLFDAPRLLLTGAMAGVIGSLLHNIIDSDWYIAGIALTFSAMVALVVAQARDLAPLATQTPRPLPKLWAGVGAVLALFLLWRGGASALSRNQQLNGDVAKMTGKIEAALAAQQAAAATDPLDPAPHLERGLLLGAVGQREQALAELQQAAQVAGTGKVYYRLGQNYLAAGDFGKAAEAFEEARKREPRNVQNLRALADTLAQSGRKDQAAGVYREITALEKTPYGAVRAMPEVVEAEFAVAHRALGDLAYDVQNWSDAAQEYAAAAAVMREFWAKRRDPMNRAAAFANRKKYDERLELYDHVLTRWQEALAKSGQPAAQGAAAEGERTEFRQERVKDAEELAAQLKQTP